MNRVRITTDSDEEESLQLIRCDARSETSDLKAKEAII
jgi:hypothetical protein